MLITKNTVIAALSTAVAINAMVARHDQKKLESTKWKNAQLANLSNYLVDIIERNDVPLNQFDRIAINDLIGK